MFPTSESDCPAPEILKLSGRRRMNIALVAIIFIDDIYTYINMTCMYI